MGCAAARQRGPHARLLASIVVVEAWPVRAGAAKRAARSSRGAARTSTACGRKVQMARGG